MYKVLITLLVLIGVAGVIMTVRLMSHQQQPVRALDTYLPVMTEFAIGVTRDGLFSLKHPILTANPSLASWKPQVESQWLSLEQRLLVPVSRIIWFIARTADGLPVPGMLIETPATINEKYASTIDSRSFQDFQWYGSETGDQKFSLLTNHRALLAPGGFGTVLTPRDTELFYFRDGFVSVYSAPGFKETARTTFNVDTYLPASKELFASADALHAGLASTNGMLRVLWLSSAADAESADQVITSNTALKLPSKFDLMFETGSDSRIHDTGTDALLSAKIQNFINSLANQYTVNPDSVKEQLTASAGFIFNGDAWLLASEKNDDMRKFGSALSAWFHPQLRVTTLSDKSPYREYIKKEFEPATTTIDGMSGLRWSRSTGLASDLQSTMKISDDLYLGRSNGYSFLTNSPELFKSQKISNALNLLQSPQVRLCAGTASAVLGNLTEVTIGHASDTFNFSTGVRSFILLRLTDQSKKTVYQYCFH